jgi:hypothetical protein
MIFSTQVQSRAVNTRNQTQIFKMLARRGHPQGRLSIHGLSATPDGSSKVKRFTLGLSLDDPPWVLPLQFTERRRARQQLNQTLISGNALRYHYVDRVGSYATQPKSVLLPYWR